jgi:hypothetical protein
MFVVDLFGPATANGAIKIAQIIYVQKVQYAVALAHKPGGAFQSHIILMRKVGRKELTSRSFGCIYLAPGKTH